MWSFVGTFVQSSRSPDARLGRTSLHVLRRWWCILVLQGWRSRNSTGESKFLRKLTLNHSTTCFWRKSFHICILDHFGYLGYVAGVCWNFLRTWIQYVTHNMAACHQFGMRIWDLGSLLFQRKNLRSLSRWSNGHAPRKTLRSTGWGQHIWSTKLDLGSAYKCCVCVRWPFGDGSIWFGLTMAGFETIFRYSFQWRGHWIRLWCWSCMHFSDAVRNESYQTFWRFGWQIETDVYLSVSILFNEILCRSMLMNASKHFSNANLTYSGTFWTSFGHPIWKVQAIRIFLVGFPFSSLDET